MSVHKRWFVLLLVSLLVIGFLPVAAQDGGTLNWSIEGVPDLPSLDPAKASDSQDFTVIGLIYGGWCGSMAISTSCPIWRRAGPYPMTR